MYGPLFLVIDIGTSSVKTAIMDGEGRILSSGHQRIMGPLESAEAFEARRWNDALSKMIPLVARHYKIDAVVISGNGPTIVAVDDAGRVVDRPLLWMDSRVIPIPASASFYLPKIGWFESEPATSSRVRWYLPFPEYLIYQLTGEAVAITPSQDFIPFIWNRDEAERHGIPSKKLPPFVLIGSIVSTVTHEAASWTGIAAGTPVVAGGSDFLMSLLGTNTVRPGTTCDRAGTSEGINHCVESVVRYPGVRTLPHAIPGRYNVAGILLSTGLLFEWFREISGQCSRDYGAMMLDILNVPDTADIPWFFPSVHRGAAWEFRKGMFIGLGAQHDSAAMGRAVVLSIGFAVREAIEILRKAGAEVAHLNACGGQAKNGLWTQMKSNIVGVPISIPTVADAELVGNLCAGMVALGEAGSLEEASDRVVTFVHTHEPDVSREKFFSEQYDHYRDRYERFRAALDVCIE